MKQAFRWMVLGGLILAALGNLGCPSGEPPWLEEPPPVTLNSPITIDGYEATLSWSMAEEFHFEKYTILFSKNSSLLQQEPMRAQKKEISEIRTTTCLLVLPEPDQQFYFSIAVVNDYGNYSMSNIVRGTLAD